MDGEVTAASKQSLNVKTSHAGLHVMVVDDDVICLSIVAGILRAWKYEVVTVKSAYDAISTLRTRNNFFHLIVTDVHMPEMDGFEFQRLVHQEFRLPVVMMSADDKESSMLRGLESGAAFYIVKPISYDDLKNLWQYTVTPKKRKSHVVIQEIRSGTAQGEKTSDNEVESLINEDQEKHNKRDSKRKTLKKGNEGINGKEKGENTAAPRKAKVIWTAALHNRFLEAARKIGLERAVPKRILEIMNVPGLTRENVASHLQKYRIFLKRVMETSSHGGMTGKNISDKTLRSSFATGHPSLMINTLQHGFLQFPDRYRQVGSYSSQQQPRFLGNLPSTANGFSLSSTNSIMPQLGCGQSHSVLNKNDYLQPPTFGNANINSLCQANNNGDHGISTTTAMQLYQHKAQARSELVPNSTSTAFTALGVPGTNSIVHGIQNNSVNNSDIMTLNLAGGDLLNNFNGGSGLFDRNNGTKLASSVLRNNVNSGYYADQGGCSSCRFGNTSQFPHRFSNNIGIQQENNHNNNNAMLLMSPSNLVPQQKINTVGEEGEDSGYLVDQVRNINTAPVVENLSIPQLAENDLDEIFGQNQQPKYPPYNEKQSEGGIVRYDYGNSMNPLDGYFPSFDLPYPTQQQGGVEVIEREPCIHGAHPESNPAWNIESVDSDLMDSVFVPGMY